MANGNGTYRILKLIALLLVLGAAVVGAPVWIESRIDASVSHEETERKAADVAVEDRQERRMERIEEKLDNIEEYIREQ